MPKLREYGHFTLFGGILVWFGIIAGIIALVAASTIGYTLWNNHYKTSRGLSDAEIGQTDTTPAFVLTFPNQFSNVARKCDGPNMVYSGSHNDQGAPSVFVVPNDPRCALLP